VSRSASTVCLLGLTQIIGFGVVYYCFAILAKDIARDFGWSQSQYFGCISIGLLAGGLTSSFAGRAFDRYGAARLMTYGSVLMTVALAAAALAPSGIIFGIAFVAANIVSTLVLYDAAFTSLVQLSPIEGSRRITYLTLIAGFASSIFWPLTSVLDSSFGWRTTLLIFAAMNLVICTPAHAVLSRWSEQAKDAGDQVIAANSNEKPGSLKPEHYTLATLLITSGFLFGSVALSAILVQMVPVFQSLGFGVSSLWVATLFGPAQVVVRFTNIVVGSNRHPLTVTILAAALLPLGLFIVAGAAPAVLGAVLGVIFIGMSSGLKSIVQGTLPLALFGSKDYGARLGFMASFRYVAAALAPFGFAWTADQFGAVVACVVFATTGVLGLASFVCLGLVLPKLLLSSSTQNNHLGTETR
jgi:MFS family permease